MLDLWRELGWYEKRLCILLMLTAVSNPFSVLSMLFYHYTPEYHCDVDKQFDRALSENNITVNETFRTKGKSLVLPMETDSLGQNRLSSCLKYNLTNQDVIKIALGKNSNSNINTTEVECEEMKFMYENGATSAVKEFDMVCSGKWKKPVVLLGYMIGKFIGSFFCGWISDKFGRHSTLFLFTAVQFACTTVVSFSRSFEMYAAVVLMIGMGSVGNYQAAIVLGSETVGKKYRNLICTLISFGYSFGYMLTPLIAYGFQNWRSYALFTGLIGTVYIPFYWFLDESPLWLAAVGKRKQAEQVLRKIARINKMDWKGSEITALDGCKEESEKQQEGQKEVTTTLKTWHLMLKSPKMIFRIFLSCTAWIICNMTYYAIVYDTNRLSGSRFMNCFYAGVTELFSYVLAYVTVEYGGRKKAYIAYMTIAGVGIAANPFLRLWNETAVTVVTMVNKLLVAGGYYVVYVTTGEMYPTAARHSALAIASTFGRLGGMLAPLIIFTGDTGSNFTPFLASGIVTIVFSLLFLFLPNTQNKPLPASVEEAANMTGSVMDRFKKRRIEEADVAL